ncbi:MAG: DUF2190 family protein [Maricaulaceae bacterium]
MRNYVQPGATVTATAPYALASGEAVLIGDVLFGVASTAADAGANTEIATVGVFDLAKAAGEEWLPGTPIHWDAELKACTATADGNTRIGAALSAAALNASIGRVRLDGRAG